MGRRRARSARVLCAACGACVAAAQHAAQWPCRANITLPVQGGIVTFNRPLQPVWLLEFASGHAPQACGSLCIRLDDSEPLCRPAVEMVQQGAVQLHNLTLGHHRLKLEWERDLQHLVLAAESWFHVTTAANIDDDERSVRARAHVVRFDRADDDFGYSDDPTDSQPFSFCQFDEPPDMAKAYMVRYSFKSVDVLGHNGESVTTFSGSEAVLALWNQMKRRLILKELHSHAVGVALPGTYFPLQDMWERNGIFFDPMALRLLRRSVVFYAPNELLALAFLSILEIAIERKPNFALGAHMALNVAWTLRYKGDVAASAAAVERTARAAYNSILSGGDFAALKRRGDPQRALGDILLVTIATHTMPELELMRKSATAVGLKLHVDNGGANGEWLGFGSKCIRMLHLLQGVDDSSLVFFIDGFDTLFLPTTPLELRSRFLRVGADIVFGSEVRCGPDEGLEVLYSAHLVAEKAFLNSGTYMGRASDVRGMLQEVVADMQQQHERFGLEAPEQDDQRFFMRYFLRHCGGSGSHVDSAKYGAYGGEHIALDARSDLFLTLNNREQSDVEVIPTETSGGVQVRFAGTGSLPVVLHGNGVIGRESLARLTVDLAGYGWPMERTEEIAVDQRIN